MIAVDASVVIAMLSRDDKHHRRARAVFAAEGASVIHTMTLAEVLVGGVRVDRAEQMARRLGELGVVELFRRDGEALVLAQLRVATGLMLPDCGVLLAAETTGIALATLDDRLARVARERGIEVLGAGV